MSKSLYHKKLANNKRQKNEHKKQIRLTDAAVTIVYDYVVDEVEEALGLMGFGPVRIKRFREKLKFVQQSKGLHRKGDPLVVLPGNEVHQDGIKKESP